MIIFLYGQDTYRSKKKLNEIIKQYQKIHKSGLNLRYLDLNSISLDDLRNEFQTIPMFKEKKLTVFKNTFTAFRKDGKLLDFLKTLKDIDDIILIYEEKEASKSSSLAKFLQKYAKSQEFSALEGEKLKNWIKKEFAKYKANVGLETVERLFEFVGNDLWQLSNEVKKLASFKLGKRIEAADVELLVKSKIETDIFKTIDAIALKNKKKAISLIHGHLENGDNPLYLLSMINFQFRNLLIIKDLIEENKPYYSILKISKLHPFIVKKSMEQAKRFSFQELKKIYQNLLKVDLSIKTGKLEPKTALDLLIIEI